MSTITIKRALLASTVIAGMSAASPALAQGTGAAQPVEAQPDIIETPATGAIVVTGSRIARPNIEQSSPVSVIDAQEISLSQPVSAEEFLRDLPGTTPAIGPNVNNGTNGTAQVNLRALGPNRNLVLLNERRVVPATLGGVADLNVIPVALIERVDVFTGGASTVYGADAVAGVVNFITRRNFAGIDISANYGLTERGDGASYRVDLTTGANFDDGRGNAVFSVGYTNTKPVLQGSRAVGTVSRSSTCTTAQVNAGVCDTLEVGNPQGSGAAVPATIFAPFTAAVVPGSPTFAIGQTNNYNFNPINVFQTPLDRWNIFGQARYEISPAVEVYTEGFFVRSQVTQQIAPSATFFNAFKLPLNNQFLTPQQRQQLCQAGIQQPAPTATNPNATRNSTEAECVPLIAAGTEIDAIVARRFVEAGPRITQYTNHVFQVTAGARGPITSTLNYDLSGSYGRTNRHNTSFGQGLFERFQQAIRGCPAGSASGCVPINIFGPEGSLTPAMFNFLDVATNQFVNTDLATAQATISGDLGWASPLAVEPIGVAVGLEYRRYGGGQRGDLPASTAGAVLGAGGAFTTIQGEYDSREAFAELVIPLVEDRPFLHSLTVEAGARYSDYSTSGGNWTYKAGANFMPIRDIKFRGVYSRAVRAPNIAELFAPVNTVLSNRSVDPCQGTQAEITARGPNHLALCQEQLGRVGAGGRLGTVPAPFAGQINVTGGGNPLLDPEIATTITAGVVLQPRFLPGAALTFDYWNIKIRDAVSAPSQADVIDGCFGQADPNFVFCQLIFRNPLTGGLSGDPSTTRGPILQASNLGRFETDGFDLGASYRRDLGFARLNWSFNGTHTRKFLFQAIPTTFARECAGYYSISCENAATSGPQPRWSWNMRTTLSFADTDISLLWRHISALRAEPQTTCAANSFQPGQVGNCGPSNVVGAYRRIPAYNWFDLAIQHAISDNMRMTLTVANLLDKDPPDVGNTIGSTTFNSGNTYPSVYDALGRRYTVGVNLRF
jgi:iron complex outermembrane recepter protein